MAQAAAAVTVAYGILVLVGGVAGYLKARSKPSLMMGGLFGAAILLVGIGGLAGWERWPLPALALAVFLLVFFGRRYLRKRNFMPMGMLAVLSAAVAALDLAALIAGTGPQPFLR